MKHREYIIFFWETTWEMPVNLEMLFLPPFASWGWRDKSKVFVHAYIEFLVPVYATLVW